MRDSSLRPLRWLAMGYSSLFRNTPLLVQLFFWYFAAGQILPSAAMQWLNSAHQVGPLEWPSFEFLAGFFGLTLYSTAFIAEEIRSGIRGVAGGQKYAAQALGLTRWQTLRMIVLPQALRMMVPSFINQWISLIKDTSLAYIVGVGELTFLATQVNNRSMVYPMEVFLFVALVYFVFCLALDLLANAVNRRFGAQTRGLKRSWRWWRNKPPLPAS